MLIMAPGAIAKLDIATYGANQEESFKLSPERNLIVLVVDSFPSGTFEEILTAHPEEVRFLKSFDFYPDTVSGYPSTKFALNQLISGALYQNEAPYSDDYAMSLNRESIPGQAIKDGFDVKGFFLLSPFPERKADENDFDRGLAEPRLGKLPLSLFKGIDTALYRASPLGLKSKIYDQGRWWLASRVMGQYKTPYPDLETELLLESATRNSRVVPGAKKQFKFIYLWGVHYPISLDKDCKYLPEDRPNRESFLDEARCVLRQISGYIEHLQEIDAYKNSEILIVSDHGAHIEGGYRLVGDEASSPVKSDWISNARSLVLHKPFGAENGPIQVKSQQMHASWVPCLLGYRLPDKCSDFDRASTGETVTRVHFRYEWLNDSWYSKYAPPMRVLEVRGDSRNYSSWVDTGRVLEPGWARP